MILQLLVAPLDPSADLVAYLLLQSLVAPSAELVPYWLPNVLQLLPPVDPSADLVAYLLLQLLVAPSAELVWFPTGSPMFCSSCRLWILLQI